MTATEPSDEQRRRLRELPAVNAVLAEPAAQRLLACHERTWVVALLQEELDALRARLRAGDPGESAATHTPADLAARLERRLQRVSAPRLRRVVNATGVVLHTNLGRAPLAEEALAQVVEAARRYSNLELDLEHGRRGSRQTHVEELACRVCGGEAALAVNNNAAGVLLMLSALCAGREVVVSRGELVEIGGAFRVPEVIVQGGARLVEVGTTNKTRASDYARVLGPATGALLKVHTSNFRVEGFSESPPLEALAEIAHAAGLPLLVDWGSGVLVDLGLLGLAHEATPAELLAAGADLVAFSGDKLLGGTQAGLLVGRRALVERCRQHPLARALRADKLSLAGLEATLRLYLEPQRALERVPVLRMLALQPEQLRQAAEELAAALRAACPDLALELRADFSEAGGGSLPGVRLPTVVVALRPTRPAHSVEAALRAHEPPVLARLHGGQLLLDPRTLWPDEHALVAAALQAALAGA